MSKGKHKVAFILPYYGGSNHSPFLGVGYLSSTLKRNGFDTIIIDEDAANWIKVVQNVKQPLMESKKWVYEKLKEFQPDIICATINTANYENALKLLSYVRDRFKDTFIVVGGPHISTSFKEFHKWHNNLFDAAIIGEGENSLLELCEWYVEGRKKNQRIKGVIFATSPNLYIPREMCDIDTLPFPDREGFYNSFNDEEKQLVIEHYNRGFYSKLPGFEKSHGRVVSSRGCNYACSFCSPSLYWRNPISKLPCRRMRDPQSIVLEIEELINQGIHAIYFDDPTFPILSEPKFFTRFVEEIKSRNLKFNWGAPICSDEIDENILDIMQDIGFTYTYFGLENYMQANLQDMNKKQNIDRCLELIQECKKRGIHCDASYQVGLPNETMEDVKRSIQWIFDKKIERNVFFSLTAIWAETKLAIQNKISSECFEPNFDKSIMEKDGLYFFPQGNKDLEFFYSNCSGTYHFVSIEEAIDIKYYIFDMGLSNRFKKKENKK